MFADVVGLPGALTVSVVDDLNFRTTRLAPVRVLWMKATLVPSRESIGEVVTAAAPVL
jgi:hypothetical protein